MPPARARDPAGVRPGPTKDGPATSSTSPGCSPTIMIVGAARPFAEHGLRRARVEVAGAASGRRRRTPTRDRPVRQQVGHRRHRSRRRCGSCAAGADRCIAQPPQLLHRPAHVLGDERIARRSARAGSRAPRSPPDRRCCPARRRGCAAAAARRRASSRCPSAAAAARRPIGARGRAASGRSRPSRGAHAGSVDTGGAAVVRADFLADVAAVGVRPDRLALLDRDRPLDLDGQVGQAAPSSRARAARSARRSGRRRGSSVQRAALIERRRIRRELEVADDLRQEDPRSRARR